MNEKKLLEKVEELKKLHFEYKEATKLLLEENKELKEINKEQNEVNQQEKNFMKKHKILFADKKV